MSTEVQRAQEPTQQKKPPNSRIPEVGKTLQEHRVQPAIDPRQSPECCSDTSRDGHFTSSPSSPFQCLTTLSRKKFLLKRVDVALGDMFQR